MSRMKYAKIPRWADRLTVAVLGLYMLSGALSCGVHAVCCAIGSAPPTIQHWSLAVMEGTTVWWVLMGWGYWRR